MPLWAWEPSVCLAGESVEGALATGYGCLEPSHPGLLLLSLAVAKWAWGSPCLTTCPCPAAAPAPLPPSPALLLSSCQPQPLHQRTEGQGRLCPLPVDQHPPVHHQGLPHLEPVQPPAIHRPINAALQLWPVPSWGTGKEADGLGWLLLWGGWASQACLLYWALCPAESRLMCPAACAIHAAHGSDIASAIPGLVHLLWGSQTSPRPLPVPTRSETCCPPERPVGPPCRDPL